MQHLLGWEPIMEGENIIGLADVTGGGAISLEPGGVELSARRSKRAPDRERTVRTCPIREARPLDIGFRLV
jgi:glutamate--cysteine ligase